MIFKNGVYIAHNRSTREMLALYLHPNNKDKPMHHSGKYYIRVDNGVLIIPEDFSYTHFINNTWYD